MLKLTSLGLGLLTVLAIAPASQAATTISSLALQKPAGNLHSQVIIKVGGQREYRQRGEVARQREILRQREIERQRQLEREREREREARRRNKHRGHSDRHQNEHRRDR